ncbi:MAG TPA: chromosome segregation protein SMC [Thermoanaerobacterales bacterium]|nr:chromosome segregation protein SMC [Thermoanaerobacterales bacterium]
MYLKRIELHGFKSFADRVELEFQPGINAIVGPNGSGKSNIIDAIRWVLGEQSIKTLRGDKLEDVIFTGSNKKKPMGMAEVAVTIDNSDHLIPLEYSEICFIRRTFRSGESEFYLNRTPCRLKDIQEILVDSGVGKDGYSVISQGQIDQILTCRADERRAIFEETAGIMKHRIRKKEAEKKLEETMNNISRIDDVIIELLNQLEPLAIQKEVALKYKELTSAFKEIDVNLLLLELENRDKRLKYIKDKLAENQTILTKLNVSMESLKKQIIEYKKKQNDNEETYEQAQSDYFAVNSQRKDLEKDYQWAIAEKERVQKENKAIFENIKKEKERLFIAEKNLKIKTGDLRKKKNDINQLELAINQNEKELTSLNNEIIEKQKLIESVKGDVIDLLSHASEKRNVISSLNTMRENLEKRMKQIKNEKLQLDEANRITSKDISEIRDEIARLQSFCSELDQNIEKMKKNLVQKASELDNSKKTETQKQQELTVITSRLKAVKEIADSYEGYQYGVKNLLIAIKNNRYIDSGIYGTVADLISVKQRYEVAIETALGGAMQNVICESEENAKKAIEFLKKNNYGRVTFLPLSTVKARFIDTHELMYLSLRGCISTAIDLVTFDKKYHVPLAYLLGRVLVSETLEDAINIARQCNFSFKIVTIRGEILNPGGSITGGSQKRSNYLLSRKRQLLEYEGKIDVLNMQLNEIKQFNLKLKNEIEDKQKMIQNSNDSLYSTKSEIAVLKKQLQEKENLLKERCQRKEQLSEEKQHIESETQEILSQISLIEADIGNIDNRNISSQSKVRHLQEQLDKNKEMKEQLSKETTELKVKLASCKQEEISTRQSLQTVKENIELCVREIDMLSGKIEENNKTMTSIDKKIHGYKENIDSLKNTEQEYYKTVASSREQKEVIKSGMTRAQEQLNDFEKEFNRIEKRLQNGNIEEATINIELNQIKNKLHERYSLTVPEALKIKKEFRNIEEMKNQLAFLKKEIDSLGPVNMQAIEDYDNLKTRYDFLKSQLDDLMKGKVNLDNLIEEMTDTMEKMLSESIKKVNDEFNKVFSELFEGGKAQLIIEGEGSILECGVEVNAQPPGKKLQSLSLLSGGERTLTAIALLFAILNTKATPFCVLDEIEAALDDVNIVRFTRYLKKVSKHTQFIMITHRKATMEVADALYGISMEDTAVSKVLAVKMV